MEAARITDGLVHPLPAGRLVELGYDRDFRELVDLGDEDEVRESEPPDLGPGPGSTSTRRARSGSRPGRWLDLGATGKAWAADLIATAYEEHLAGSAIVSVGGDLRIARPDGRAWPVAIAERPGDSPDRVVALDQGGLATSSTRVRRWTRGGARHHHLLDPRTGLPARVVWRTVTATGSTCSAANAASTAAIVLGSDAPEWLAAHGVTARLVHVDGGVRAVGTWPADSEGSAA